MKNKETLKNSKLKDYENENIKQFVILDWIPKPQKLFFFPPLLQRTFVGQFEKFYCNLYRFDNSIININFLILIIVLWS